MYSIDITNCFWRGQVCSKLVFPMYGKLSSPEKSRGIEPHLPHPEVTYYFTFTLKITFSHARFFLSTSILSSDLNPDIYRNTSTTLIYTYVDYNATCDTTLIVQKQKLRSLASFR